VENKIALENSDILDNYFCINMAIKKQKAVFRSIECLNKKWPK
jgi:hypothetical protein